MRYIIVAVEEDYRPEQLEFEILAQAEVEWGDIPAPLQAKLDEQLG